MNSLRLPLLLKLMEVEAWEEQRKVQKRTGHATFMDCDAVSFKYPVA